MSTSSLFSALHARRTNYALTNSSPIPDSRITDLVAQTLRDVPSAFNSQTARIVVVLNAEHRKLWDAIADVYRAMLPADKFAHFKERVDGFRGAYGTLLFYEDGSTVRAFQEKIPAYEDKFPGCVSPPLSLFVHSFISSHRGKVWLKRTITRVRTHDGDAPVCVVDGAGQRGARREPAAL